ncbi:helix-turn-helix transcriptional regulator [Actinomadura fibrosa]|uniref:Helix-turn-helix transcriptional regulator n=1 Tax=Actinomadura fibrosa TaxID=111802 RepID=A0ABW2XYY4_9ACTN|nr:WYL domain-containing protein [Actinomadura fibrosa]
MSEYSTTERALRLLELLQARGSWSGGELAGRLGVDGRTLRRDVVRLRGLGYHIEARRGPEGGYRLSTGGDLPPLAFTPDEALAVAAALASSAASGAAGGGEVALTALAKIEQVMPQAVRRRVRALRSSVAVGGTPNAVAGAYPAPIDTGVLAALSLACRDAERVRLRVMSTEGAAPGRESPCHVEPAALVPRQSRWYLVCRDLDRGWRVLRVDRITGASATGVRFHPQEVPGGDPVAFVAGRLGAPPRTHTATILIHAPIEQVQAYMGGFAADFSPTTTAAGQAATHWRIADVRLEVLAGGLLWVRWPFEVIDSPELADLLRDRSAAFAFAADPH